MLKLIRLIGSTAFAIGTFVIFFVGLPWIITVVEDSSIGGQLPLWFRASFYLLLGGIAVVMFTLILEQLLLSVKSGTTTEENDYQGLLVENSNCTPGMEISEVLGIVHGHTVYAIWLGKDIAALVKLILGGELTEYTQMMGMAREIAVRRMSAHAYELGADGIINVRFMTTSVVGTASELLAYGTAVKLQPLSSP